MNEKEQNISCNECGDALDLDKLPDHMQGKDLTETKFVCKRCFVRKFKLDKLKEYVESQGEES